MASRDLHDHVLMVNALNSTVINSNTTTTSSVSVDTLNFEGVEIVLRSGAWTDGSYTANLQDSNDNTTWTNVDPSFLVPNDGTAYTAATINAANQVKRFGYIGKNRYVRLQIVSTGVTSGATLLANAILGYPRFLPSANN